METQYSLQMADGSRGKGGTEVQQWGNETRTMKQVDYIIGYYLKSVHWKGRQKITSDHAEF
jgi:hypothetical protein